MLILELTYSNENKLIFFCNGFIYNIFGKNYIYIYKYDYAYLNKYYDYKIKFYLFFI